MKNGLAQILFLLIFGFSVQCNAEQLCAHLDDFTTLKSPSHAGNVNCEKYILCKDHMDISLSCPNGYGYNAKTKSCSWRNEACETHCKEPGQVFANPSATDCKSFHYCKLQEGTSKYELVTESCPDGQIFNPTGYGTYERYRYPPPCSAISKYFCPTKDLMPDCEEINDRTYIPDPNNCHGYYYCQDNVRLKSECDQSQYHFDIKTTSCINKSMSSCQDKYTPSSSICEGKTGLYVADNDICTAYYICLADNLAYQGFCPKGTYFNDGICSTSRPATCTCEDVEEGWRANVKHEEANHFWECEHGKRTLKTCFSGSTFDEISESCMFAHKSFMPDTVYSSEHNLIFHNRYKDYLIT